MKRIALFAVLAALAAAPAWAQSDKATEKKATAPLKVDLKPDAKMEAGMPAQTENIKPLPPGADQAVLPRRPRVPEEEDERGNHRLRGEVPLAAPCQPHAAGPRPQGAQPKIEDYALMGDTRTAALVSVRVGRLDLLPLRLPGLFFRAARRTR